jgi:hypothetical protein
MLLLCGEVDGQEGDEDER